MENKNHVAVVGGGASGLIAAIAAARNGAEVIILERMNRVGKKILATGNGRCNLTNVYIDISRYHGTNPGFIFGAYRQFNVEKTIEFFEELGVACHEEEGGKIFPYSGQASSVLDVMRYEIERLNVKEICEAEIKQIKACKKGFELITKDGRTFNTDKVIVAAGGKAGPNLGSNGSGYSLVAPFGHKLVEPFPALVQLRLNAQFLKALKGVKFDGEAAIEVDGEEIQKEKGEILFTDYGISGPPIFQLSRRAGEQLKKGRKPFIRIDMFPYLYKEEVEKLIEKRIDFNPQKPLDFSFVGLLNKRLIPVIIKEAGINNMHIQCGDISKDDIKSIVEILKNWRIEITGTQSWMDAQVTAGGIDVKDVNPVTMESKLVPGLYLAGEILDIDGDCGGFNLQWAWSSGYTAGYHAASS